MRKKPTRVKFRGPINPGTQWFHTTRAGIDYEVFKAAPLPFRGYAMASWNLSTIKRSDVVPFVREMHRLGYGGFFAISCRANASQLDKAFVERSNPHMGFTDHGLEYLSDKALDLYRLAAREAARYGLGMIFYDDYAFPTGNVAGQFYKKFPQQVAARLDRTEQDLTGPGMACVPVPEGTFRGAVLVNRDRFTRHDVSRYRQGKTVRCRVPAGRWKLLAFSLNRRAVLDIRNPGIMNYLEKKAVRNFLSISYDRFYARLKGYFGTVIPLAFYDEPALHWMDGRMWSVDLDTRYRRQFRRPPLVDYPVLWHYLGPETAAIRNAFFGLRARLYADFLVRQLAGWCQGHRIGLTGHMDQEEVANPVPITGDLMKIFEHQDVPGADDIFWWGRSNPGYKVVTSAAFNYDKPVAMCETYAAYRTVDRATLYRVAMDQFARGVNFQCPTHGGLKRRVERQLPAFNAYVGRLSCLLRAGRHVADVAVLYPIASLQAGFVFGDGREPAGKGTGLPADFDFECTDAWKYAYQGGPRLPEIDYLDVGETLFLSLRTDYTYLHPEVLQKRCTVQGNMLVLNNRVNREAYRVLVIPGGRVISVNILKHIKRFYEQGGTVVATTCLPYQAAERGKDRQVQKVITRIFGVAVKDLVRGPTPARGPHYTENKKHGRAYFVPRPGPGVLRAILRRRVPVPDVAFTGPEPKVQPKKAYTGALTYIHKVKDGRQVYFFANSSSKPVDTLVTLRGRFTLSVWDPHTGRKRELTIQHREIEGQPVTRARLVLPAVYSIFWVSNIERETRIYSERKTLI